MDAIAAAQVSSEPDDPATFGRLAVGVLDPAAQVPAIDRGALGFEENILCL